MNYMLGTGYHEKTIADDAFALEWVRNLHRYANPMPECVVVISTGEPSQFFWELNVPLQTIDCSYNLGHVGQLLRGEFKHQLCGWSAAFLGLAMISYNMGLDFLFLEQDCLAFGPFVQKMYHDLGDGGMIFGGKMMGPPWMACAQSLALVKHDYIPLMIYRYLSQGSDGTVEGIPENKFAVLKDMDPNKVRHLSFGFDRERPLNFDLPVWYAQRFTEEEMAELKRRKMI